MISLLLLNVLITLLVSTQGQLANDNVEKVGSCPPLLPVQICSRSCSSDSNCQGIGKCCPTSCGGFICSRPVTMRQSNQTEKPGSCPAVPSGRWVCSSTCSVDSDCKGKKKCCKNRCGALACQIPETEDVPPVIPIEPTTSQPDYNAHNPSIENSSNNNNNYPDNWNRPSNPYDNTNNRNPSINNNPNESTNNWDRPRNPYDNTNERNPNNIPANNENPYELPSNNRYPSNDFGNRNPYENPVNYNPYETSVNRNPYETSVNRNPYETSVNRNPYETSINRNPYETSVNRNPYDTSVNRNPYENPVNRNPYEIPTNRNPYEVPVNENPYELPTNYNPYEFPTNSDGFGYYGFN